MRNWRKHRRTCAPRLCYWKTPRVRQLKSRLRWQTKRKKPAAGRKYCNAIAGRIWKNCALSPPGWRCRWLPGWMPGSFNSIRRPRCVKSRCWNIHPSLRLTAPTRPRAACVKPANTPVSGCSRSRPWPGNATNWPPWILHFCSTPRGIYLPLDSMSPNAGLTPAFMICWPRRRACAAMSPSPWDKCRKIIGSRWDGCSSLRTASRSLFRGAARCSNI